MAVFSERSLPRLARDGSALPEGWSEVALQDLVVHAIGGEWGDPEPVPGSVRVRVLRGTEFRDWARDKGATAAVRWIRPSLLAKRRLQAGDLVVEISGGSPDQPVGRTLLVDDEALRRAGDPLICSNFCRLLRLQPAVDAAFVQLALQEIYLREGFAGVQTQTTNLRNLRFQELLAGTVLRLPPIAEQRRIALRATELLRRAQEARERLARAQTALKRFRQAVLAAATSGRLTEPWRAGRGERRPWQLAAAGACLIPDTLPPPSLPAGWTLLPLRQVAGGFQYGTSLRAVQKSNAGVPVLRMVNIQDGAIDLSRLKVIDRQPREIAPFLLRRGDILFNRTNSPELVGKAAVFDHDFAAVFASYLVRIACDEERVSSRYVCAWINSPWGRRWSRAVRTDCVSQSNVNASKLRQLPLPAPPRDEQEEIVRRIDALFAVAAAVERRLAGARDAIARLPRTILERALR